MMGSVWNRGSIGHLKRCHQKLEEKAVLDRDRKIQEQLDGFVDSLYCEECQLYSVLPPPDESRVLMKYNVQGNKKMEIPGLRGKHFWSCWNCMNGKFRESQGVRTVEMETKLHTSNQIHRGKMLDFHWYAKRRGDMFGRNFEYHRAYVIVTIGGTDFEFCSNFKIKPTIKKL